MAVRMILFLLPAMCGYMVASAENIEPPAIEDILARADSVSRLGDSVRAETTIKFKLFSVMNRLNGDNAVKESDTTIAVVTMKGEEEISREIIYSSKNGDGKSKRGEKKASFSFDDPAYNYSLTDSDESSYKISVVPKSSPPGEGEYAGTVEIDKQRFFLKRFDFDVPDPEGALKEFAIDMDFELLEGELLVPVEMKMRGFVKALMGIIRVRFSGEIRFSEYRILE